VVAILEGSGIDLINCRCLPPLPDDGRPAVKRRGHSWKFLLQEHGSGVTDTRNRCLAEKFRHNLGQPEKYREVGLPTRESETRNPRDVTFLGTSKADPLSRQLISPIPLPPRRSRRERVREEPRPGSRGAPVRAAKSAVGAHSAGPFFSPDCSRIICRCRRSSQVEHGSPRCGSNPVPKAY
jgi:hypothetical protein